MKKILALLLLSFLAGSTAFAADGGPYLADRHVARGMKCADCHTPDNKLKTSGDLDICASCHGDYQAMIKKTDGRYEVNPHGQHEGALPCSECHNFVYKVP